MKQQGMKGTKFVFLRTYADFFLNKTEPRFITLLALSLIFKILPIPCFPEFPAIGLYIALRQ